MPESASASNSTVFGFATNLTGGGVAVLGGFTTTEWMAIMGGVCAVLGLFIQAWSTIRKDRRDQQLHDRRMKKKGDCDVE